jgi:hypothetical protein
VGVNVQPELNFIQERESGNSGSRFFLSYPSLKLPKAKSIGIFNQIPLIPFLSSTQQAAAFIFYGFLVAIKKRRGIQPRP